MEEQQNQNNQPVMDIMPPEQAQPTPEVPADLAASMEQDNKSQDSSQQVNTPVQPAPESVKEPPQETADEESKKDQSSSVPPKNSAPKKPMSKVLIALLVGLVLAVACIAAYFITNKDNGTQTTESNSQTTPEAATESIDTTTTEIDTALKSLDAESDFPSSDLTDSSLGL